MEGGGRRTRSARESRRASGSALIRLLCRRTSGAASEEGELGGGRRHCMHAYSRAYEGIHIIALHHARFSCTYGSRVRVQNVDVVDAEDMFPAHGVSARSSWMSAAPVATWTAPARRTARA